MPELASMSHCCFFFHRLVVQAVDKGNPPLSTTTVIRVQVVDVNDNSPAIPPMEPVLVSESNSKHCSLKAFLIHLHFLIVSSFLCIF